MKIKKIMCLCMVIVTLPLFGQRAPGAGRAPYSGLFSVATPGAQGRFVTVGGRVSPKLKVNHTVSVPGFIDSVLVQVGDYVEIGEPLLRITRNVAGETFLPVIVESRINGIVSEIDIFEKQEVSTGTTAVTILDNSSYKLETSISDRDTRAIRSLGNIDIVGKTTDGESFKGKILYVSQEPDYDTGLFTLNMEFPYQRDLSLGMVLFVDIEAQKPEGVKINSSAIFKDSGKAYIWKLTRDGMLSRAEVVLGSEEDGLVTINSGLSPGESYLKEISGNEVDGMDPKELL